MKFKIALLTILSLGSSCAFATENYVDINYMLLSNKYGPLNANPTGYQIRYGNKFAKYMGVEVYYGGNISSDNFTSSFTTKVKELIGYNFVLFYDVGSSTSLAAKFGYGAIKHESDSGAFADDLGFTYGFGINLKINSHNSMNLEYMVLPDVATPPGDVETTAFTIGYRYSFNTN